MNFVTRLNSCYKKWSETEQKELEVSQIQLLSPRKVINQKGEW